MGENRLKPDFEDAANSTKNHKLSMAVSEMNLEAILGDLENPFAELWEKQDDGSMKFKYFDEFLKIAEAMDDTDYDSPYWWVDHAHELWTLNETLELGWSDEEIKSMESIARILSSVDEDGNIPDSEGDLYQQEVFLDQENFRKLFQAQWASLAFVEGPTSIKIDCRQSYSSSSCNIECSALAFGVKSCGTDMKDSFLRFLSLVDEFYVDALESNSIKVTFVVHNVHRPK